MQVNSTDSSRNSSITTGPKNALISGTSTLTPQSTAAPLSHGAIAGIAIGGFVAVILLLALGIFIYKKRFRPKPPSSINPDTLSPSQPQIVGGSHMMSDLGEIEPGDSVSQPGRLDISRVDSPSASPPPSTTTWETSVPPARR